jgi:hypothetical protein
MSDFFIKPLSGRIRFQLHRELRGKFVRIGFTTIWLSDKSGTTSGSNPVRAPEKM